MTKFQYTGQPADYPTLGFSVTVSGGILDGAASSPPVTTPPDARWAVYVGGSAETGITRSTFNPGGTPSPQEPATGAVLTYNAETNEYEPVDPIDTLLREFYDASEQLVINARRRGDLLYLKIIASEFPDQALSGILDEGWRPDVEETHDYYDVNTETTKQVVITATGDINGPGSGIGTINTTILLLSTKTTPNLPYPGTNVPF